MLAHFIPSKWDYVCLHFTSTYNWPILNVRANFFTTVILVQFCVSKSPSFNVTSLIAVQLACNNTEMLKTLHPVLICSLPINRFPFVTQSEYHAKYMHSLLINWSHIVHLNPLNSSHRFRNSSPLFKQLHSSGFLRMARRYSMTCTDIRSCRCGFTMIQFCLFYHQIVQPSLAKTEYWLFVSLSLSPTALQPGVGLGLLQEFPPSFPV